MKIKDWALIIVIALGVFLFWDWIDYNTQIKEASIITDIPQPVLKILYPYIPFSD